MLQVCIDSGILRLAWLTKSHIALILFLSIVYSYFRHEAEKQIEKYGRLLETFKTIHDPGKETRLACKNKIHENLR